MEPGADCDVESREDPDMRPRGDPNMEPSAGSIPGSPGSPGSAPDPGYFLAYYTTSSLVYYTVRYTRENLEVYAWN